MFSDLRLGFRMAVAAGSRSWLRLALGTLAGVIAGLLMLSVLAALNSVGAQEDRFSARIVHSAIDSDTMTGLRMSQRIDSYHDELVTVYPAIVSSPTAPVPPGLDRWPESGKMAVSPAVANALAVDPSLRARYPQPIAAVIGKAGLVQPDELIIYVVVPDFPDSSMLFPPVNGFGDAFGQHTTRWSQAEIVNDWVDLITPARVLSLMALLYILLPLAVVIGFATRLSAATRDRKLAALRAIGFSARRCQLISAVETILTSATGTLLGVAGFFLLRAMRDSWSIGPIGAFSSDLTVGVLGIVGVVVGIPLYAMLVSAIAVGPSLRNAFAVARRAPRRPSRWRWLPLGIGVAALLAGLVIGPVEPRTTTVVLLLPTVLGGLLTIVGAVIALPLVLRKAGAWLAAKRNSPAAHLAGASLHYDAAAGSRVLAGVMASLCVAGAGAALSASVRAESELPNTLAGKTIGIDLIGPASDALLTDLRHIDGVLGIGTVQLASTHDPDKPPSFAIVGSCASLRTLYFGADNCRDGHIYRTPAGSTKPGELRVSPDEDDQEVVVPQDASTMPLRPRTSARYLSLVAVVTEAAAPASWTTANSTMIVIDGGVATADQIRAVLSARSPATQLQGPILVRKSLDVGTLGPILTVLAIVTLSLGGIALIIAATDDVVRRRRDTTQLRVVGLAPDVLRRAAILRLWLPTILGGIAMLVATVAACATVMRALGKPVTLAAAGTPLMLGAIVVLCGLLLVPAIVGAVPQLTAQTLRRE